MSSECWRESVRTGYGFGHRVPLLQAPQSLDRSQGRPFDLYVASPGAVPGEIDRHRLVTEATRDGWRTVGGGDIVTYRTCPRVEIVAGATLAGTAAGFIPGTSSPAFTGSGTGTQGAGGFWYPGRSIKVTLWGVMTTAGASPGTFTGDWKVDTVANGTTGNSLGASPASATLAISITAGVWCWESWIVCRSVGTAGTLFGHGRWQPNTTLFSTQVELFLPNVSPATAAVDTTQNSFLKFIGTLGSASDNMNITAGFWEILN
jgi:hypothetical protein